MSCALHCARSASKMSNLQRPQRPQRPALRHPSSRPQHQQQCVKGCRPGRCLRLTHVIVLPSISSSPRRRRRNGCAATWRQRRRQCRGGRRRGRGYCISQSVSHFLHEALSMINYIRIRPSLYMCISRAAPGVRGARWWEPVADGTAARTIATGEIIRERARDQLGPWRARQVPFRARIPRASQASQRVHWLLRSTKVKLASRHQHTTPPGRLPSTSSSLFIA